VTFLYFTSALNTSKQQICKSTFACGEVTSHNGVLMDSTQCCFCLMNSFFQEYGRTTLLKQKHERRTNSGAVPLMVPKMFFFWNQKCSLFEKNVLFSGTNHDLCLKK
jgi:hypothetical protein